MQSEASPKFKSMVDSIRNPLDALLVCLSRSWGGLEQVTANDAMDLGAAGLKIRLLCLEGTPIHETLAHRSDVTVVPLNFRPRNYFDLKLRAELRRLIEDGINLIHTHQTSILGSIVPWLWGYPSIAMLATRHIMNNHRKKDFFHRAIYRRLDAFIVQSETMKENILETHAVLEKQLKVISLGLSFARFDPEKVDAQALRTQWGADPQTTVIGLVGRIDPAKGQAAFLKAAATLMNRAKEGEKVKFVVVGEETIGSPERHLDELHQIVNQFHLQSHVVFTGFLENIPQVMKALDIFVMPSRQEAFGLVAIEALAMGCPIIISRGGSSAEIVGNEEYGLLIRPDDAFDLHRQLRYLLDRPEERREMGRKGREYVRSKYSRQTRLERTVQVYQRALLRRGNLLNP